MHYFDASTRTDLPIPFAAVADVVSHLRQRTDRLVIVGAVARDLLASGAGDLPISRATQDVDIAIAVETWDHYADLGDLVPSTTHPHHLFGETAVDVIPFGPVENSRHVRFANYQELDVTGIAEAADHAVEVTLPGGIDVPVASLQHRRCSSCWHGATGARSRTVRMRSTWGRSSTHRSCPRIHRG